MAKTREQKEKIIEDLNEKFGKMKIAVFANYFGLKVKEIQQLKKQLKESKSDYLITKKTLAKLALQKAGFKNINLGEIEGGLSIVFGYQDEIVPIKVLTKFSKEHNALEIKGGILEKEFISLEKVLELSKLPTKTELIGRLLWQIKAPISGLINTLEGNLRGLIWLLKNAAQAE